MGQLYWASKAINLFMTGQSPSSWGIAKMFIGEENLIRLSPVVQQGRFSMDGVRNINVLRGLDQAEARKQLPRLRHLFLKEHVSEFVPNWTLKQ